MTWPMQVVSNIYDYVNVSDYVFVNINVLVIETAKYRSADDNICDYVNVNVYIVGDLIFYPGSMSKKRF